MHGPAASPLEKGRRGDGETGRRGREDQTPPFVRCEISFGGGSNRRCRRRLLKPVARLASVLLHRAFPSRDEVNVGAEHLRVGSTALRCSSGPLPLPEPSRTSCPCRQPKHTLAGLQHRRGFWCSLLRDASPKASACGPRNWSPLCLPVDFLCVIPLLDTDARNSML